jgi:hypothetical protein
MRRMSEHVYTVEERHCAGVLHYARLRHIEEQDYAVVRRGTEELAADILLA